MAINKSHQEQEIARLQIDVTERIETVINSGGRAGDIETSENWANVFKRTKSSESNSSSGSIKPERLKFRLKNMVPKMLKFPECVSFFIFLSNSII